MTTKWLYGDSWEKYPIEDNEAWRVGNGRVAVANLFEPLPDFMLEADLLFIDPPWNCGNVNSFYTKAGRTDYISDFNLFINAMFRRIQDIKPETIYIEMGNQYADQVYGLLPLPNKQRWPVTYYKKHLTNLLRCSNHGPTTLDFTGMDEADCIKVIAKKERYSIIGDMCMGRGLVGIAAQRNGRSFVGTELNKRRLACLIEAVAKLGGHVERMGFLQP